MTIKHLGFLLLALVFANQAFAQKDKKEKLQLQRAKLLDEIALANKILEETRENQVFSVAQVEALLQKIAMREKLLKNLQNEIEFIEDDIDQTQKVITKSEAKLLELREQYANMIRSAQRHKNRLSRLLFLLSSSSFNQAILRMEYMKQLAEHRRKHIERIAAEKESLKEALTELEKRRSNKLQLLKEKEQEVGIMQSDMQKTEDAIKALKQQEKEMLKQIEQKRKQSAQLESEIQRIIKEELAKARALAVRKSLEERAKKAGLIKGKDFDNNTKSSKIEELIAKKLAAANVKPAEPKPAPEFELTPEGQLIADNFTKNKGALPWPVEKGIITGFFGKHPHPIAKSVVINNNGIDIATEAGAMARAVFEGEVSKVVVIPYGTFAVIIRHGNYFSVYDNIAEVLVKQGDKVKTKQAIGKIHTDSREGKTSLHFEIWMNSTVQNPQPWLFKK